MTDTFYLVHDHVRYNARRAIEEAPHGYVVTIKAPNRSAIQNAKAHAMIQDILDQVPSDTVYGIADMKLRFMNALGVEMRFIPCLDGRGSFPVGQRTSDLNKTQFAALITLIEAYGARHDVVWSDPQERQAA